MYKNELEQTVFIMRLETAAGSDFTQCVVSAHRIAKQNNCVIGFDFQDGYYMVWPDFTQKDLADIINNFVNRKIILQEYHEKNSARKRTLLTILIRLCRLFGYMGF